jgi:hypothetical protein
MFFKSFLQKRKNKKAKRIEETKAKLDAKKAKCEDELAVLRDLMLSKPCPFLECNKCSDECVHFDEGYVYHIAFPPGSLFFTYQSPRCNLWGKR